MATTTTPLIVKVKKEMPSDEIKDYICRSSGYHLHLHMQQDSKLRPGWFKTNAFIKKISILGVLEDPQLTEIEPGTFNDCTFSKMTELYIRRTKLTQLKRGVFEGASSLKWLVLDQNIYLNEIEEHTLDPLYQLEFMVMMQQRQFENLLNFTGTTQLKQLSELALSWNNFSSSINAETFKGCTSVESIYLHDSLIQTIGIGSFDPMAETIRYIDLSNNQLKHLPTNFLTNLKLIAITLSYNSWHCGCDSLELQSWINSSTNIIADNPLICATPAVEHGNLITDADLSTCELDSEYPETDEPTSPTGERLNCVDEIWGHDEIIIALVCSIVLSLVVGLLCGWLLSHRYQRFFKAKSTSKTETSTMTSDYVGGPNSKPLRRTYSDNSIVSCKSYITAVTPSPFEIIQWKLRKNAMNLNEFQARDYLNKLDYDCLPPPVPPHPNRRHSEKIYETIGEPVYTCTSDIVPYGNVCRCGKWW